MAGQCGQPGVACILHSHQAGLPIPRVRIRPWKSQECLPRLPFADMLPGNPPAREFLGHICCHTAAPLQMGGTQVSCLQTHTSLESPSTLEGGALLQMRKSQVSLLAEMSGESDLGFTPASLKPGVPLFSEMCSACCPVRLSPSCSQKWPEPDYEIIGNISVSEVDQLYRGTEDPLYLAASVYSL